MFTVTTEIEARGACHRFAVQRGGAALSVAEALELWQESEPFRDFFVGLLQSSPFTAFRWETPPVTLATVGRPFEFVLVDSPWLDGEADPSAFRSYFRPEGQVIVPFENLGGDALLVVPSPRTGESATGESATGESAPGESATGESAYGHLAAFVRRAPLEQVHALWRCVGREVQERIGDRPLWLSTAGGGVPWLHVRLDSRPKYYCYAPYRRA